ncbi:hypothetical protein Droror1_Dr00016630 [Drosera rotundifolia]
MGSSCHEVNSRYCSFVPRFPDLFFASPPRIPFSFPATTLRLPSPAAAPPPTTTAPRRGTSAVLPCVAGLPCAATLLLRRSPVRRASSPPAELKRSVEHPRHVELRGMQRVKKTDLKIGPWAKFEFKYELCVFQRGNPTGSPPPSATLKSDLNLGFNRQHRSSREGTTRRAAFEMVMAKAEYEECRRKRVEENMKRMEQLNLHKLSDSLKKKTPSPMMPSPAKVKPKLPPRDRLPLTPVRRSSRVADKLPPNYKEYALDPFERPGRRVYNRRDLLNRVYASDNDRMHAIQRAKELEASLDSEFPVFVKPMLQSHVTGGFWLGLPVHFCKIHLPHHDEMVMLVDEDNQTWETKYLALKTGLSGGWRGFSIDHELVDGDALVFQLINPTTFKVYIIKVKCPEGSEESNAETEEVMDVASSKESEKKSKAGKRLQKKGSTKDKSVLSE